MTTPQTDAPTLQERLRKAKGSELLPKVLLGMFNAEHTCLHAADTLDARESTIAALVDALKEAERKLKDAADYWDELCNDEARAPYTIGAKQARSALAKAAALK